MTKKNHLVATLQTQLRELVFLCVFQKNHFVYEQVVFAVFDQKKPLRVELKRDGFIIHCGVVYYEGSTVGLPGVRPRRM
jgi:hypothetical protein